MRHPLPKEYQSRAYLGSKFGWRKLNGKDNFHNAIDLKSAGKKVPCYAADNGVVESVATNGRVDKNPSYSTPANYVIINHGNGYKTGYWHLSWVAVKVGQRVKKGDRIGNTGNTGYSFGVHLHFIVWKNGNYVNPEPLIFGGDNLIINNTGMSGDYVTVGSGWGLSHVAAAAGMPANESTYQAIYNLNKGHRGSWDWQSLNARMGAGDRLRVRVTSRPAESTTSNKELEEARAELKKQEETYAQKLAEQAKVNAEKLKTKEEEIAKLQLENQSIDDELESLKKENEQISDLIEEERVARAELEKQLKSSVNISYDEAQSRIASAFITVADRSLFDEQGKLKSKEEIKGWFEKTVQSLRKYDWKYLAGLVVTGATIILTLVPVEQWELAGGVLGVAGSGAIALKLVLDRLGDAIRASGDRNQDGVFDLQDTETLKQVFGTDSML